MRWLVDEPEAVRAARTRAIRLVVFPVGMMVDRALARSRRRRLARLYALWRVTVYVAPHVAQIVSLAGRGAGMAYADAWRRPFAVRFRRHQAAAATVSVGVRADG